VGCTPIEAGDDFKGLTHEAREAGLLGDQPRQEFGEARGFLFGPFRGQHPDHMGDQAGQGLDLTLQRVSVHEQGVLRVIHFVEGLSEPDDAVANSGELRVERFAGCDDGHGKTFGQKNPDRRLAERGANEKRSGLGHLGRRLAPASTRARAVEEIGGPAVVFTNGGMDFVEPLVRARRAFFGIVGDHLQEMNADALHINGDHLGVEQGALEDPTLEIDLSEISRLRWPI
jgi:hypothetical protein